jgi:hypothetical protein
MTFDSPIEKAMADALSRIGDNGYCPMRLVPTFGLDYESCRKKAYELIADQREGELIYPSVCIGPYELDFLILYRDFNKALRPMAVECYGHDDRRRDRYLALHSILMFRFTGGEVFRDAIKCAEELHRAVIFGQSGPRREWAWHGDPLSHEYQEEMERKYEEEREREAEEEWQGEADEEARKQQFIEAEIMSGTYEGYYP